MKIHILRHESFESPGAIIEWATNKGHSISYSNVHAGDTLPKNSDSFDFLIIMGGPQSPATTKQECSYFDSAAEQAFIKQTIAANKAVLGICLGAQLIGEALGAKFEHSPHKEIGVFNITLTAEAKNDPIFSQLPSVFSVAHWHGDMPGLTPEAHLLAHSEGCPRQIIRYTPKVYGFQCHFEFTQEAVDEMIRHCGNEIKAKGPYIQNADTLRQQNYREINETLFFFLDHFFQ
ncbi:MAG: gamma-glutamyl-gamma-aminobutyrate hydrolase family protein [Gammaproteobacteria bacterium]